MPEGVLCCYHRFTVTRLDKRLGKGRFPRPLRAQVGVGEQEKGELVGKFEVSCEGGGGVLCLESL